MIQADGFFDNNTSFIIPIKRKKTKKNQIAQITQNEEINLERKSYPNKLFTLDIPEPLHNTTCEPPTKSFCNKAVQVIDFQKSRRHVETPDANERQDFISEFKDNNISLATANANHQYNAIQVVDFKSKKNYDREIQSDEVGWESLISQYTQKITSLQNENDQFEQSNLALAIANDKLEVQVGNQDKTARKLQQEVVSLHDKVENLQEQIQNKEQHIDNIEHELQQVKQQIQFSQLKPDTKLSKRLYQPKKHHNSAEEEHKLSPQSEDMMTMQSTDSKLVEKDNEISRLQQVIQKLLQQERMAKPRHINSNLVLTHLTLQALNENTIIPTPIQRKGNECYLISLVQLLCQIMEIQIWSCLISRRYITTALKIPWHIRFWQLICQFGLKEKKALTESVPNLLKLIQTNVLTTKEAHKQQDPLEILRNALSPHTTHQTPFHFIYEEQYICQSCNHTTIKIVTEEFILDLVPPAEVVTKLVNNTTKFSSSENNIIAKEGVPIRNWKWGSQQDIIHFRCEKCCPDAKTQPMTQAIVTRKMTQPPKVLLVNFRQLRTYGCLQEECSHPLTIVPINWASDTGGRLMPAGGEDTIYHTFVVNGMIVRVNGTTTQSAHYITCTLRKSGILFPTSSSSDITMNGKWFKCDDAKTPIQCSWEQICNTTKRGCHLAVFLPLQ